MTRRRHPNYRPLATLPPELRRPSVPPAVRSWIRRELRSDVRRTHRLAGASSTAVHRLDLADGRSYSTYSAPWRSSNGISSANEAGLTAARARGRKGGRPTVMTPRKIARARELYGQGNLTVAEIAKTLKVSRASIYRHLPPEAG